MFKKSNLWIIAIIAVVNALGYGIIIPILYSYSHKFGLTDWQNGMLFSVFSVCQFISTPIIGRMSDKLGRKPLLVISLIGTCLSFVMMALAKNAVWLFLARALDGLTAGNITVAQAVISDTTAPADRAKGFGIIGASFGFGFVFGPAISAVTVNFGMATPFWVAALVTMIAVVVTAIFLPETNMHRKEVEKKPFFDLRHLWRAFLDKNTGEMLLVSLLCSFAFALYIYAYQPFSVQKLGLSVSQIASMFTLSGVIGLLSQGLLLPRAVKKWNEKQMLTTSMVFVIGALVTMFFVKSVWPWILAVVVMSLANVFVGPMIQAIISKEADALSQGSMLGINASYISLGMIFGPVVGGFVATWSLPAPFLLAGIVMAWGLVVATQILKTPLRKQHAF